MSNGNKFIEGLALGGILGFLGGLLAAPKAGSDLRKQLLTESEELCKQATESVADMKTKTNEAIAALQAKGEDFVKMASDNFPGKKERGSDHQV